MKFSLHSALLKWVYNLLNKAKSVFVHSKGSLFSNAFMFHGVSSKQKV